MNIEQNTKHAARATQVEKQVEKKANTRHRLIDTGKQTRNVLRETEAIVGKAPRLWSSDI